jgi:hypothetical protein
MDESDRQRRGAHGKCPLAASDRKTRGQREIRLSLQGSVVKSTHAAVASFSCPRYIPAGCSVVERLSLASLPKLQTGEYRATGKYPVIDQGQGFIAGGQTTNVD